jgi:hypothetical protein
MTAVGILWVLATPYCTGLLVAWSRRVNRIVTRHLRMSTTVGWTAVAILLGGVFAVGGHRGMLMALASAPLVGLSVWKPGPSDDDDFDPPAPSDDPPPPREDVRPPSDERAHHRRHHVRREPFRQRRVHVQQAVVDRPVDQV